LKQAKAKTRAVVVTVILMVTAMLVGTQCAAEKPPEPPTDEGPVVIAASDSPADAKAQADFVCDGDADNEEIQAAIDEVSERGGGEVILLEGTFLLANALYVKSHVTLRGQGYDTLLTPAKAGVPSCVRVKGATDAVVSDLRADANGNANYGIDVIDLSQRVTVENCWAYNAVDDEITVVHGSEDVIIRNCTAKGRVGGPSKANIEIGDEAKRVTVSNNTLLGGHEDRMGIHANLHPGQWGPGEDFYIIGNTIDGVGSQGIQLTANRVTVSDNTLTNIGGDGIRTEHGGEEYIMTNNVLRNCNKAPLYISGRKICITGNHISEGYGGISIGQGSQSLVISDNIVRDSKGDGIKVAFNGNIITVSNNILENNAGGISIDAPATEVTIVGNRVSSSGYGLTLGRLAKPGEIIGRVVIDDNDFDDNSDSWLLLAAIIKELEVGPPYADSIVDCRDAFKGCPPASTDYIHRAITGTGTVQEITTGITNPDFPRNISITATNNANPSDYVRVDGINARGDTDSEEIQIVAGGSAYGNKAFATITRIIIPAGVSPADTVEIGVSDKLGLSHPISAVTDVYMVNDATSIPPVDVANGTIDFATIKVNPDPNFPNIRVQYKSRLTSD